MCKISNKLVILIILTSPVLKEESTKFYFTLFNDFALDEINLHFAQS